MLTPFRNFSLSRKLLSIIMVTCSGALILACAVIMVYDLLLYREDMSQQLSVQADIIGANSTIALAQQDRAVANQTLQALRFQPGITQAIIYAKDGVPFATFYPSLSDAAPVFSHIEDLGFDFMTLSLVREIMDNGHRTGTIVIQARLDEVQEHWMAFVAIVGGVIFASSLFAFLLSNRLQTLISDPILRLTSLAQRVSSEKNYSLRETKNSQDEIGTLIDGVNDMLEQIQHRDRQLQQHQEKLEGLVSHRTAELAGLHRQVELILDTAGEGIIGLDQQGRAEFVNAAASRMLGWTGKELQGQSLHHFIHQDNPEGSPYLATEYANPETAEKDTAPSEVHDVFWRKDGTSFPVEYMRAPIRDDTGLVTGFVMTFRDVTVQKQFEAALVKAVQTAEEANEAKSRFLANMSHEIRTPMNGLLGMSELLLTTQQTPKQHQFTESLHRSGQHLLHIINDILDFSKIEAAKLTLETIDFSLHQTLEDTVQLFAEPAQKKGVELICHIERSVPTMAKGDPSRLRQILTNLLGNAIKFTHQGEVYVHCSITQKNPDSFDLSIDVQDTGIGIPLEVQAQIFEPFSQADSTTTRKFGGTGLGLTITKQLTELMGGHIQMSSIQDQGSTFSVHIPLGQGNIPELPHTNIPYLPNFRMLLVEDNPRSQLSLEHLFTTCAIEVRLAADGAQALQILNHEHLQAGHFQAIFIDQTLPDMDGIELASHIRGLSGGPTIPLVLLTPWHMTEDNFHRASQIGLDQQILKPVRQVALYNQLRDLTNTTLSPLESLGNTAATPVQHSLGSASILLAEDHQVNQEIVKAMAEHLGLHLEVVNNGLEAIQALARQSYDLVLMDWQMPEMDGLEATKEIRKREASGVKGEGGNREDREASSQRRDTLHEIRNTRYERRLPIIAITAHTSSDDRLTCLKAGTDDVLPKPFTLEQLQATLTQWLPSSAQTESCDPPAQKAPPVQTNSLQGSSTAQDIVNTSALDQIKSLQRPNAPNLVAKVLNQYFSNTPKLLADLQEGLRQADMAMLCRAAHTLKSSSANVGAMRVSEKCKTLEHLVRSSQESDGLESLVQEIVAEYEIVTPLLTTHCTEEIS